MYKIRFDSFNKVNKSVNSKGGHPRDKEDSYEVAGKRENGYRYFEAFKPLGECPLLRDNNLGREAIPVEFLKKGKKNCFAPADLRVLGEIEDFVYHFLPRSSYILQ